MKNSAVLSPNGNHHYSQTPEPGLVSLGMISWVPGGKIPNDEILSGFRRRIAGQFAASPRHFSAMAITVSPSCTI